MITNNEYNLISTKVDGLSTRFDELIEFLGTHFGKIDQRFERIDERFEKIEQRFERMDERFEKQDSRLERLEIGQDKILGELQNVRDDMTVGFDRVNNIEKWVLRASKKIKIPYNP